MIAQHHPASGWIRLGDDTLRALALRKAQQADPTFDATVAALLEGTGS